MAIDRSGERVRQLRVCLNAAAEYHLSKAEAADIIEHQLLVAEPWNGAADAAQLTQLERQTLWGRQILNPFIRYDYEPAR